MCVYMCLLGVNAHTALGLTLAKTMGLNENEDDVCVCDFVCILSDVYLAMGV